LKKYLRETLCEMNWWNKLDDNVSRNWDDDIFSESDIIETPPIFLKWSNSDVVGKFNTETVIIGSRIAASIFLNVQFPEMKEIGSINIPPLQINKAEKKTKIDPSNSFKIYIMNSNCIIICDHEIPPERLYEWTKVLFDNISVNRVFVLDTISHFQVNCVSKEKVVLPSLRCLYTEPFRQKLSGPFQFPLLASPQVIDKLPASILTHCQLHTIEAILFLSIEEDDLLRVETIVAFEFFLSSMILNSPLKNNVPAYTKLLRKRPLRSTLNMFC